MGAKIWKHLKEHPPPLWRICMVFRPWALFYETTVNMLHKIVTTLLTYVM